MLVRVALAIFTTVALALPASAGPTISLDFEQTEAHKVLDEIGRLWGRPIFVDPWVRGKVSIRVQDIDANEAVKSVLAQLPLPATFYEESMTVSLQTKGSGQGFPQRRTIPEPPVVICCGPVQGPFDISVPPSGDGLRPGDRVTLDFDRVEVSVALTELAQQLGERLEVDPWLRGKVTLHVQEADPIQAIGEILSQLALPSQVTISDSIQVKLSTDTGNPEGFVWQCLRPANVVAPTVFTVKPGRNP